ncbi:MAG: SGNH/GDSL hydrolase family protein [Aureispira sp.]
MNIRYFLKCCIALPLLPIMYFQARAIKARFPILPEAEGDQGSVPAHEQKRLRILAIGESSIAGVGVDTHEEGFTGTLAKELSRLLQTTVDWKVYAKRGFTAKKVEENIVPQITENEEDVDLLVVGIGGNDTFQLNRPKRWKKDMQALIAALQEKFKGVPIVFIDLPPVRELPAFTKIIKLILGNLREMLAEELDRLVLNYKNTYYYPHSITMSDWIERYQVPNNGVSTFFSDGVHPSKLAYQVWATDVARFMMAHPHINNTLRLISEKMKR